MFDDIIELWARYSSAVSVQWEPHDPRHHLSSEVQARLVQLDIVLTHVAAAMAVLTPDPDKVKRSTEWFQHAAPKLDAGAMSEAEYFAGFPQKTDEDMQRFNHTFAEMRLFAEMFYFVSWRLRQVLNARSPHDFPGLRHVEAKGIRAVRNLLIEHPEQGGDDANYRQHFVVTDVGPILKSSSFLVRGGRSSANPDSLDKGLYVNATELHDELHSLLLNAIP